MPATDIRPDETHENIEQDHSTVKEKRGSRKKRRVDNENGKREHDGNADEDHLLAFLAAHIEHIAGAWIVHGGINIHPSHPNQQKVDHDGEPIDIVKYALALFAHYQ